MNEKDFEYLRNIDTRPGPNAGRSIDPTKPGPDADADAAVLAQSNAEPVAWQNLPPLPDDDTDFTPDLARKIIAKYQEALRTAPPRPDVSPKHALTEELKFGPVPAAYCVALSWSGFNVYGDRKSIDAVRDMIRPDTPAGPSGLPPNQGSGGKRPALEIKISSSDASAGLIEAAEELADLMDDVVQGNYKPDTFTTQPLRKALRASAADRGWK